ncbi:hypothetical protein EDD22DRAFT_1013682 [Suillus occidentalis]|nr:hypothetical protein EDD22DRAFT_1013682 [Suillus occidentalis]
MSHLSARVSDDDSDSDWDEGNTDQVSNNIPGPNASKGELWKYALKALQLEVQQLRADNRALKEKNKVLVSEKPKRKRRLEMFPDSELLIKKRPDSPTPFNSADRYKTSATQESAFLDELYTHFPERIHETVMGSEYFKDLVHKCIADARSNEIKKLRGIAGDIFELPGKYFANASYDRAAIVDIQKILQEDTTLKTVFGQLTLFAKILRASLYGVTSLHQEPCGGSKTNARKWSLQQVTPGSIAWLRLLSFFCSRQTQSFQKLLITNCLHRWIPAGAEDFSEEINRAMLALDMDTDSEEDTPVTPPVLSALSVLPSAISASPAPSLAPGP